jgi:hypothetical protein
MAAIGEKQMAVDTNVAEIYRPPRRRTSQAATGTQGSRNGTLGAALLTQQRPSPPPTTGWSGRLRSRLERIRFSPGVRLLLSG